MEKPSVHPKLCLDYFYKLYPDRSRTYDEVEYCNGLKYTPHIIVHEWHSEGMIEIKYTKINKNGHPYFEYEPILILECVRCGYKCLPCIFNQKDKKLTVLL